jgi:cell division protein FtsL
MTLFGIVPSAAPSGQHTRDGAIAPAGTQRQKEQKQPSAVKQLLDKLSLRERVLIAVLLTAAIASAVAFFVVLPAITTMQELEAEILELEGEKAEIRIEPDRTPQYQEQLELATRDFENYRHFYYPFMDPETIDQTVTNLLLDNNLEPERFAMTAISVAPVLPYTTRTLVPKPVPTAEEIAEEEAESSTGTTGAGDAPSADGGTASDGSGEGSTGRSEELAANAEAAADNAPPSAEGTGEGDEPSGLVAGLSIYCYTIDVEAKCWMEELFDFLDAARGITAMEVVSYSYIEPPPAPANDPSADGTGTQGNTSDEEEKGSVVLQLKLYVFVEGGVTSTSEE